MTNLIRTLNLRNGSSAGSDPDGDGGSARRLLRLLMSFNAGEPVATAEQLARRAGLPLSSTYRYLALLREFGLVEERGRTGFYVGAASIRLSQAARAANPLEQIAQPFLYKLSSASDESVVLLRRVNEKAICIAGVESAQHIRTPVKIGTHVPLHIGAGPKLLLAMLSEPTRSQILQKCAVRYKLDDAQTAALQAEVKIIDDCRWAESSGSVFPDVFAVSAPVRDEHHVVASLCVVAPLFRVGPATVAHLRHLVIESAEQISVAVSGHETKADARGI
jgi:DNA-binding IclR family transcriptional regulator